jgi:hypothetical protein
MHGIPGQIAIKPVALQGDHYVPPAKPLRVLVVDGELLIRWSLAAALEEHGHHVHGSRLAGMLRAPRTRRSRRRVETH